MILRRFTLIVLLSIAMSIPVSARTAADFFVDAPDVLFPTLPRITRLDMLDYFRAGSETSSKNYFNSYSRISSESPNCLSIADSKRSSTQVAVLSHKNDTIIAIVNTVCTPVEDSRITFFTTDWKTSDPYLLNSSHIWFTEEGQERINELSQILPFFMVKAEFNDDATVLTLTNNAEKQLIKEEYDKIKEYLIPTIIFDVVKNKLKPRK